MAEKCDPHLVWKSDVLGKRMRRLGINDRTALARKTGLAVSTVHENFAADWSGRVISTKVLITLCRFLDAPITSLVQDPRHQVDRAAQ